MKRLGVIALVLLVGAAIQPSATTFDVRFPVITCLTDTAADEKVIRINCRKPTEVVDALQWQVDALS